MSAVGDRDGRQQMREVRAFLMRWDPIGVADAPEAADEYDGLVGPVLGSLHRGADAAALSERIALARVEHLGLAPDPDADRALAETLVRWWRDRVPPG